MPDDARNAAGGDREPSPGLAEIVYTLLSRRVHDLRIEFDGCGLILHGRAESCYAKQLAQHMAMAAVGLPLSADEIVVSDSRRESPSAEEE